jgi:hypothetical protein
MPISQLLVFLLLPSTEVLVCTETSMMGRHAFVLLNKSKHDAHAKPPERPTLPGTPG